MLNRMNSPIWFSLHVSLVVNLWTVCSGSMMDGSLVSGGNDHDTHLYAHGRECKHNYPKHYEVMNGVYLEPHHKMTKRSLDQPLRIALHYDQSVYALDEEKKELISKTVLPNALEYWQKALMVRRTENRILLNRRCPNQQVYYTIRYPHLYCRKECDKQTLCGEVVVPEDHLDVCRVCDENGRNCSDHKNSTAGNGILNADFVFYVSALQTERCQHGFTVAYAAHCQQEATLDRPIAGHANLCPDSISTKPQELDTLISTVKHEILHALGFSVSLYAFYRDDRGEPLTERDEKGKPPLNPQMQARQWSDRVIKTIVRPDWRVQKGKVNKTVHLVVTPRVVKEARRHFKCEDLEGAELEDQGEEGTALTHWEKRIFENEAMTGTHTQNPVYSRITLALMEDTGWYKANYDMAQSLDWGHQLGCDFVKRSCKEWIESAQDRGVKPLPYCDKVKADLLETQCTDDHSSVALCNLIRYTSPLPIQYQNFGSLNDISPENSTYFGGSIALADYCPYVQEFTWRVNKVVIRGSHCLYEENDPEPDQNFALEEYGEGSKCFYHTEDMWVENSCKQRRGWHHWGSGCYKYKCENGLLSVLVNNYTFPCYYEGYEIEIKLFANGWLHNGGIKCPRCDLFCDDCVHLNNTKLWGKTLRRYHTDELKCSSNSLSMKTIYIPILFLLHFSLSYLCKV